MGVAVTRTIRYNRKGVGISYTDVEYADSTSNSVAPTTGWQTAAPAWQNGHYIWTRTHIVYTDGTDQYSNPVCIPSGKGIASIVEQYYQSTSATELVGGQWVDNTAPAWVSGKYIWTRSKITYTDGTVQYTDAINPTGQKGDKGDTGVGISSVTEYYLASSSSSGVTTSTPGWTTDPTATAATMTSTKKYLWNYERINYTDGTHADTTPARIGTYGDRGVGITSITEYYLATSAVTGVTRSTSGWTTSIQTVTSTNKYLWNYEKVTYTDGTTANTDPVIIGVYGDKGDKGDTGVGISSVTEYYLASSSSSGVTTSTPGWTTDPTATAATMTSTKKYLWNYERINYTDGTHADTTPARIGTYGDRGVGITSITEYYLATSAVTGVTRSTSGWTTSIQTVTSTNKYLWNYEKVTYTDGTTANTDPVIIGTYGDKGDQGDKGDKGDKGDNAVTYSISLAGSVFYRDPNTETIYVDIKGKVYRNAGGNTYAQSLNRTDLSLYFLKDDDTQDAVPNVNNIDSGYTVSGSTFATKFYNGTGYAGEKAFVAVLSIDGVERVRESIQITKNGERGSNGGTGSQGPRGYRGPGLRGPQDWNQMEAGYQFYKGDESNQEPYEDFVVYNGYYYKCIKTHTKAASRYPYSGSEYWVLSDKLAMIAANVLFAKHGYFGSAIISGDWLISTNGMVDNTVYNNGATYNGIIAYSLFNENNPSGDPITKFSGSGPYTLAASDTTKNIGTVTLEEGKTYKLTATGKCGSSSGSYYIRLRYGSNGATNTPVMINGTSDVTRSGVFTANASGTYYIEFYNTSGLTGTVTNVVLDEMNFAPTFALDLLTGTTYQHDGVFTGFVRKGKTKITTSNINNYKRTDITTATVLDFDKCGSFIELSTGTASYFSLPLLSSAIASRYTAAQKDRIRSFIGTKLLVYNNSGTNLSITYKWTTSGGTYGYTLYNGNCVELECKMDKDDGDNGTEVIYWDVIKTAAPV